MRLTCRKNAIMHLNPRKTVGEICPTLFSSFIEHLGRAIYGGIYEPDHPCADESGFRKDVLAMVQQLNPPLIRYPGGNFVSNYEWEDGVGPRAERPVRLDLAWSSLEPNLVGICEFKEWCDKAGAEIMMTVNLGTRGIADARNLLEYCNFTAGTKYSELRRLHGYELPFGIRYWCLGNEMDGEWQIGAKTADEYGRLAVETAKVMKLVDPNIKLIVCGSSNSSVPTYKAWEETVLRYTYDYVDYLSLHHYFGNTTDNSLEYLACSRDMDSFISDIIQICDRIKLEKKSEKTIYLSFDEWNVWFHSIEADKKAASWSVGPHLLEDIYTLEDALVVGCLLITLLKHCDRVKIACLAQLVNVIAPIMTENGGSVWAQTIFYPFLHASHYARGKAMLTKTECGSYYAGKYGEMPHIDSIATVDEEKHELVIFAVNRSLTEEYALELATENINSLSLLEHLELSGPDLKAVNTAAAPNTVIPLRKAAEFSGVLSPQSWNVIRYRYT